MGENNMKQKRILSLHFIWSDLKYRNKQNESVFLQCQQLNSVEIDEQVNNAQ